MDPYDIGQAFAEIEAELIASMIRNMKRHRAEETKEGFEWTQWQAQQLKALEAYKKANKKKYGKKFRSINNMLSEAIKEARAQGNMDQEIEILEALKKGFARYSRANADVLGEFFKLNDRKLNALLKATIEDFTKGEQAILRMAEDQYRQIIFNAQVYANTGAGTYEKAVDMATKDFLERGINCIEYSNGARHTMSDYADMAIRTAAKRAYLAGEGEKRKEWGISLVIVNKRGNPCPKCLPFVGKILIDDVYSGGSKEDGNYPLLSRAMELGLYHPRCKDSHSTYFEGISTPPDDRFTEKDIEEIKDGYTDEQKRNVAQHNYQKYSRMAQHSLDKENQQKYAARAEYWKGTEKFLREKSAGEIEITMQSIANVKAFNCELLDKSKQARLMNAHKRLLMVVRKEKIGTEYAAAFDLDMNQIDDYIKGESGENRVKLPKCNIPFIVIHNHPSGEIFSESDILHFINDDNMRLLTVVGNNGKIYAVEKTAGFNKTSANLRFNQWVVETTDRTNDVEAYTIAIKKLLKVLENENVKNYI